MGAFETVISNRTAVYCLLIHRFLCYFNSKINSNTVAFLCSISHYYVVSVVKVQKAQIMDSSKIVATLVLAFALFNTCSAMECYVCSNQTGNREKCLNTIKTCNQGEEACLTEIRWGSTPYFSLGALNQFYVSKRCASKDVCEKTRRKYMPYCSHIWYNDWTCSECCLGERCNYYVISGAPPQTMSLAAFLGTMLSLLVARYLYNI